MKADSNIPMVRFISQNKYLLLVLVLGVVLVLLPGENPSSGYNETATDTERRLCHAIENLEGVGETDVLLAEEKGRTGGYTGAVIFCQGADSAGVRLQIVEAVSVYTGLSSNKIMVLKMKS